MRLLEIVKQFFTTYGALLAFVLFIMAMMLMVYGCAPVDTDHPVGISDTQALDYVECWSGGIITYQAQITSYLGGHSRTAFYVIEKASGKERRIPMAQCYLYLGGK